MLESGCKFVFCRCKHEGVKVKFCYHCARQLQDDKAACKLPSAPKSQVCAAPVISTSPLSLWENLEFAR